MNSSDTLLHKLQGEINPRDRLPRDFWENLDYKNYESSLAKDRPGDILSYDSHMRALNVNVRREDITGTPRYHVTVTDNEVAFEALSKNRAALDSPGFIVGSRTFQDFKTAITMFFAAHQRVNELGY